jgi:hypothetical protein
LSEILIVKHDVKIIQVFELPNYYVTIFNLFFGELIPPKGESKNSSSNPSPPPTLGIPYHIGGILTP